MIHERFTLEGISYYQQGRKCGKPGCKCAEDESYQHGPYWYSRDVYGKVKYIGKELPEEVARARAALVARREEIQEEIRDLEGLIAEMRQHRDVLARLRAGGDLNESDKATVRNFGYGECLVYSGKPTLTQDDNLVPTSGDAPTQDDGLVCDESCQAAQDVVFCIECGAKVPAGEADREMCPECAQVCLVSEPVTAV